MNICIECCRLRESSLAKAGSNPIYEYKHKYLEGSFNRPFSKTIIVGPNLGPMNSVVMEFWSGAH